jgi:pimeloyl-ACP methyl ester carboxylesterase
VDELLADVLPDQRVRQFMMTNAVREAGGFHWRLDPDILAASTVGSDFAGRGGHYDGEALLVRCGRSPYVRADDREVMARFFPNARMETILEADHWPHVTAPAALEALLRQFLRQASAAAPAAMQ